MKFEREDKKYLDKRNRYSKKHNGSDIWSLIDHWPLYVGKSNLGRFMAISDLLRSTLDVPGHIAEFGSWRGANLMFMAKLIKTYDPFCSKVTHCFDSFEGLTTFVSEDGNAESDSRGEYAGNYEELIAMIDLYELGDDIEIHKGLIQDTLPVVLMEDKWFIPELCG